MAQALDRQFRQRDALSRLDYLILSGDGVEDVFRTAVSEALSYLPFEYIELDVEAEPGGQWFRYEYARGEDGLSKTVIENQHAQNHSERSTKQCTVAGIVAAETKRGTLRGICDRDFDIDLLSRQQLEQLADRIAMALEFYEQSAELSRRAWYDDLTGLPNRESCMRRIDRAIATADYNGHMVALLYIDLDGFKTVNDSLGHESGDELIRLAAERIMRSVGHQGITARLGGDEFAVTIPYSAGRADDYKDIGRLILSELRKPFRIGNSEAYLGASIGTARYPEDGDTHSELLRKADAAMYRAKDSGRGRQIDYSRTLGLVIEKRLRLEADLNRALERDEMSLVYQPQVDLRTGVMCSAEALLRWNHTSEGFISPDEFIPIAEETNQILTIGNWVLFNACAQFSEWLERGLNLSRIAVNVSANQLRQEAFLNQVKDCIDRFALRPGMLELELTERVFVDSKELSAAIDTLRRMGVAISIDDFGTGYSSLGSLRHLEFDMVKIDRAFVGSLPHDKQAVSIIQAVLAMCRTLEKAVVAEGVETSQQLQYLAKAGVEYAQGYYFSKPVPAQELERIIRAAEEVTDNTIHRIVNITRR
jgi:diguanylate cyclase (GGDEF)-like protein